MDTKEKQIQLHIDKTTHRYIRIRSAEEDCTMKEYITKLVKDDVEKRDKGVDNE